MNNTIENLKQNGFEVYYVETEIQAKKKIFELIPKGSEVMTMSSVTLDTLGISEEINDSGQYNSVKNKLMSKELDANYHAASPEFVIGSVHAITQKGEIVIVSASGSQLPAYAYGAKNVIWVVGIQKLVNTLDDAFARIKGEVLVKEDARAMKAYGMHTGLNKILIVNKEVFPGRVKIILVNQTLGY
ncbi:MAG: lactate utilization protein [Candidatus Shapirobacteria bacterium]